MAPNHPRFCFFVERQVGIGSAAQAIEPYVKALGHAWCDVTYVKERGFLERLPLPQQDAGTLRGILQVNEMLRRGPYDGLFFLTHNPAVFHPFAVSRYPTVLWTDVTPEQLDRQAAHYGHAVDGWRGVQALKRAAVRSLYHRARLTVGWSEWTRRSFVEDYEVPRERTCVVPPGVDLRRWQAPPRLERVEERPRLLFVGGDFTRKGGQLLLDVYRRCFRGRAELDLVTREPVPPEEGVSVHRNLRAGSEELLDLYRKASVFVLPTLGDCFSMASLEAMAMGLPVVVSDVGGIGDIVEDARSGFLVPPGDGAALGDALDTLLRGRELRHAFGRRGRFLVERRFDAVRCAEELVGLLVEVALASPPIPWRLRSPKARWNPLS